MIKTKKYKVRVTNIDYSVTEEDVQDYVDEDEIPAFIQKVKDNLPKEMEFEVICRPEDLEDIVIGQVTDHTQWLVNSLDFEVLN